MKKGKYKDKWKRLNERIIVTNKNKNKNKGPKG